VYGKAAHAALNPEKGSNAIMKQRKIKNVYKSERLAIVFLLICEGKQTLSSLKHHLKMKSDSSLQLYLRQLMDNNLISREKRPKWEQSDVEVYFYFPNLAGFVSLTARNGKIERTGQKHPFTIFAKKALPEIAKKYFNAKPALKKSLFGAKTNLLTVIEIFNSMVAQHLLYYKKNKTEEENFYLQILMSNFLNPAASLFDMISIFKGLEIDENTVHSTAKLMESEMKISTGKK